MQRRRGAVFRFLQWRRRKLEGDAACVADAVAHAARQRKVMAVDTLKAKPAN
jgi:hypothetical protein